MTEKKILFFFALFLGINLLPLTAQQRSYSQVIEIADRYLNQSLLPPGTRSFVRNSQVIPASHILQPLTKSSGQNEEAFYIVVYPDYFVIISGDERMKPILGYSDKKNTNFEDIPSNMRSWLSVYNAEYTYARENVPLYTSPIEKSSSSDSYPAKVNALLGPIIWDQWAPYNDLCPKVNDQSCPTGCVATAMAQLMMYHQWPLQGEGSHSYLTPVIDKTLSADFGSAPFDWENMRPNYQGGGSEAAKKAVAWLMYCCGISIETTYTAMESSSSDSKAAAALVTYFKYDKGIRYYQRDLHTYASWIALLKKELSEQRPVIYGAQAATRGGHCFVVDGYNEQGLFHINWGWSGGNDGFYELSSLNPGYYGPGSSVGGFNVGQTMVTGIQKPTGSLSYLSHFSTIGQSGIVVSTSSMSRNGTFSVNNNTYINNADEFTGDIQAALYQNGQLVTLLGGTVQVQQLGFRKSVNTGFNNLSLPTSLSDGTYQLYIVTKDQRETEWQRVDMSIQQAPYYNVEIKGPSVSFTNPVDLKSLHVKSVEEYYNLYNDGTAKFKVVLKNDGSEWTGRISLALVPTSNPSATPIRFAQDRMVFPVGEKEVDLYNDWFQAEPGQYKLLVSYSYDGNQWFNFDMPEKIMTVYPKADINGFKLTLKSVTIPRKALTEKDRFSISIVIENTGTGPFDNKIYISLAKDYMSTPYEFAEQIFIDAGKTYTYTYTHDSSLQDGEYKIYLRYKRFYVEDFNNTTSYEVMARTLSGSVSK